LKLKKSADAADCRRLLSSGSQVPTGAAGGGGCLAFLSELHGFSLGNFVNRLNSTP
jgi:hypothetical protein